MIAAVRCAEGWCEPVTSWDFRGLVVVAVVALIAWAVVRCG